MELADLIAAVPGVIQIDGQIEDCQVTAPVVEDNRQVEPGGVFVARTGGSTDGHQYIPAAVAGGAAAVVGERLPQSLAVGVPYIQVSSSSKALAYLSAAYYGFPSRHLVMIGITGTDGKTTTTNLVYSILKAAGIRAGMISTISAMIGDQDLPTGLHVTTPTAPEVQAYLSRMVDARLTHCVLEATSHGLAQHRVSACDFDIAVVTNIQHEHLDFHDTWDNYRDAKARLFRNLTDGARKPGVSKTAVINLDDRPSADYLLAIPADRRLAYSTGQHTEADIVARDVVYHPDAMAFGVEIARNGMVNIRSALVGEFNVSNILAAISVAVALEIEHEGIFQGIEKVKSIPGRMERVDEGQDFLALVDFAHTPNALKMALQAARGMIAEDRQVIVVFGSAGLRDPAKRALMGKVAIGLADRVIITAEDPRTESLEAIMAASAEAARENGGIEGETFWRIPDRGRAIFFATQMARSGDIVLACGKGHEQSMCFGATEYPWDDRAAMRSALRGAPLLTLPTAASGK
nr:UDP-N-acetylmuramoyl-L-alanyl-D-glutamate--2,6-diaminopimelate ligase [Anaerolineae bacterium]